MTELSDELLVAYVDGQLGQAQKLAVDRVLEQDEVLAARVQALKDAHSRLESAFDAILSGAVGDVMGSVPVPPPRPVVPRKNALPRIGIAVACVGLGLMALVAGYGWPVNDDRGSPPVPATAVAENWQDRALSAQSLLDRASVEVSPESQANQDLVQMQLAQALGPSAKIPSLDAEGFKFARGQLLRFGDRPLAQILYLGATKPPLALYAMRGDGARSSGDYKKFGTLASVAWTEGGMSYLLAGEEDEATLRRLAGAIGKEPQASGAGAAPASDPTVTGSN